MHLNIPIQDVQVCSVPCVSAAVNDLRLISCSALSLTESREAEAKEAQEVIQSLSLPGGKVYFNE